MGRVEMNAKTFGVRSFEKWLVVKSDFIYMGNGQILLFLCIDIRYHFKLQCNQLVIQ